MYLLNSLPPHLFYGTFFGDHPGEPVPEENFWTLWCKGRLTEADTPTIRLSITPSGLTSAHLHHPPIAQQFVTMNLECPHSRLLLQQYFSWPFFGWLLLTVSNSGLLFSYGVVTGFSQLLSLFNQSTASTAKTEIFILCHDL